VIQTPLGLQSSFFLFQTKEIYMSNYEDTRMVLVATDFHAWHRGPHKLWVDEWVVEPLVSGTLRIDKQDALTKLKLAPLFPTKSGTTWYVIAGPYTISEIEEGYATGTLNGKPFPAPKRG
jgi:hypothetical protein